MELINISENINLKDDVIGAIGEFDGIHLGHQALINETLNLSKKYQCKSAIITFYPHPDYVLNKRHFEGYLTNIKEKEQILEKFGIDYCYVIECTKNLLSLSKEEFYNIFLSPFKGIVSGYDFCFGKMREGNISYLKEALKNKIFKVVEKKEYLNEYNKKEKISSNAIRVYLNNGNMEYANKLLGYKYSFCGNVKNGSHIGSSLGFPTANIELCNDKFIPRLGVYASKIYVDGKAYFGICNIGINPSINTLTNPRLEVNIFDLNANLYDKYIRVELYKFIRDEIKFDDANELKLQIEKDKEKTLEYFKNVGEE